MTVRFATAMALVLACSGLAQDGDRHISTLPVQPLVGADTAIEPHPVNGALLVIGFSRESNQQARAWDERLSHEMNTPASAAAERLPMFNVVVLAGAPRLIRSMVKRLMKSTIPEARHASYYIVEEQAEYWRALAAVADEAAAYVLRIDPAGRVCSRHEGPVSDHALENLLTRGCPREEHAP